ncbi:hypothetical protein DCG74_14635 [Bradyrhizobium sp. WBAH42]|nr:hypothetical protein [Bradyrhizobium sp. WBAH30]MDD1545219.1 hypothetical protein [Bradyrhizobium sp. WBAH41]MDD1558829.1 hypothetical protein [Bradyrhizobium sp. WBAH23]MDD1566016.1 hypothetical protein [Bradyrhizobium sp. WBAH33]MDD1591426.1 hypothetical protein [Bradyrhizobium sp. WBAH42]NRB89689.1 hypothetical protein [Bradyrhizobium sp. WBAH10]QCJ89739.1 hypothetical protein DAA57_15460 [Bradyrhizobium yuanmingense]
MRRESNSNHDGTAPPLPLSGEGWGEGVSATGQSPRGQSPHPALCHSRGFASASLVTAAEGGLRLSRKRERLQLARGATGSTNEDILLATPAISAA